MQTLPKALDRVSSEIGMLAVGLPYFWKFLGEFDTSLLSHGRGFVTLLSGFGKLIFFIV